MAWKRKSPPDRYVKYTEGELAEMRRLAAEGMSRARIAEAIGRTEGSVSGVCAVRGIETKGGRAKRTPEFKEAVKRLAAGGKSSKEIGEAVGEKHTTILTYCSRHSIKIKANRSHGVPVEQRVGSIRPLAAAGMSAREIGEKIGVTEGYVAKLCSTFKITTRGTGRSGYFKRGYDNRREAP